VETYLFDKTADQECSFNVIIPHSYLEGSDITPVVHWCPMDTDTGDVVWALEYSWANIDVQLPVTTTITIADAADGTARKHQLASFAAITGTGKTIGSVLSCRFYRDVDPSDDYTNDAALLSFGIRFKKDARGSGTVSAK
jgi:hypothetical protein